jgi:nitrate/TMAO reductase-like tetraheme cytochrome c subunit
MNDRFPPSLRDRIVRGLGAFFGGAAARLPSWTRVRFLVLFGAAVVGSLLLVLLVVVGSAAWYTSRSQFCNSCHIMEPYYNSWKASSHKDVACIECHFAPGFGGKIRGKMLGLVQLAKYVTKSQGSRPAAEVPDASCLRSGCHETRLLSGKVQFHGIAFDHGPHLGEMRREKKLRCTSCHSQIVQGMHMTVTATTCFLCHFKDQPFDEGLSACTRCHQIPAKEYDLGGGVKFTHELAYKKGVECANCHRDVIRGNGEVPRERCQVCHNREGDLARIKDHAFIHAKHVTEHAIDCLNCHLRIEHSFDKDKIAHSAADCAACHPNHHQEQIAMFEGLGGKTIPAHAGGMLVTRVGCQSCHRLKEVSATGSVLWKASAGVCAMCHEAAEVGKLQAYHAELRASLPVLEASLQRAAKAVVAAKLPTDREALLNKEIAAIGSDLSFLQIGNDIHNIHYAGKLNRALLERIAALCRTLKIAEPKVTLPPAIQQWK